MFNSFKKKMQGFLKRSSRSIEEEIKREEKKAIKDKGPGAKRKIRVKKQRRKNAAGEKHQTPEIIQGAGTGFTGKKIGRKKLDEILWDLEVLLYESDVATDVVDHISGEVRKTLMGVKIRRDLSLEKVIERALKNAVEDVLKVESFDLDEVVRNSDKPVVIMFVGINGTGKTTTIAKIAHRLLGQGYSCIMAACDTFRAGAIEQLEKHANNLNIRLVKQAKNTDPSAIAYDAIEHARAKNKDVVLVDTAGRMHSNVNLMNQMKKIKNVAEPDSIIFVGDALGGNDVIEQALRFNEVVGIDATVLAKIDTDAKGGAALSIAYSAKKPIAFLGVGQEYEDLQKYNHHWMLQRLFA